MTTTEIRLDTTGTRVGSTTYDEYGTFSQDTAFIPTDDGEFILALSRGMYHKDWTEVESLRVQSQITITRAHAEQLLKVIQEQLAR
jgi:hypothetical protein